MSIIYEPNGRAREYAALAVNLYAGCNHGCMYCYVPPIRRQTPEQFHGDCHTRDKILHRLELDCKKGIGKIAGSRTVVTMSFTGDAYCGADTGLTREAIMMLHNYGYDVEIITKAGMRATRDFDLLSNADAHAATLTFISDQDSLHWEPEAALPADRCAALRLAHSMGIRTWASLEPVIDPKQSLELILQTFEYVDKFKVGKLNYKREARAIDWYKFGHEAEELLIELGKDYYLKNDLRAAMV
jgi:DNA repair photolyase